MARIRELFDLPPDALERFFTRWYGPPTRDAESPGPGYSGPVCLASYYGTRLRWTIDDSRRPYHLCSLTGPATPDDDGVVELFWEEQGVESVGFLAGMDDPPAMYRLNTGEAQWTEMGEPLSQLLLHAEVVLALLAGGGTGTDPHFGGSCAWMSRPQLDELLAPLEALPLPGWPIGSIPHLLWAGDDVLALAGPNPDPGDTAETSTGYEVRVDGLTPTSVEWLADSGILWTPDLDLTNWSGIVWDVLKLA